MSIQQGNLTAIADAIRAKTGSTAPIKAADFAAAIANIPRGGDNTLLIGLIGRSLTSITIPDSVTAIGSYAFAYYASLTSIEIPDSVTTISDHAFYSSGLTSITIPDSVTAIDSFTFSSCGNLTSVEIPDSVTTIGIYAFSNCSRLMALIIRNQSSVCTLTGTSALSNTPIASGTGYTYVPTTLIDTYKAATNWSVYADQIRAIEDYPDIAGGENA